MANWTLANGDGVITITNSPQSFSISKSYRIILTVSGDVMYLDYSFAADNRISTRLLEIDYTDVSSPSVSSASALKTLVQSWIDSVDPLLVPLVSKTIVDGTQRITYRCYEITGSLNLTINGNGKFVIL